jgi:hypothetical protein
MRASIERKGEALSLQFVAAGDIERLVLPSPARPERAEGLWQHSCFELFLRKPGADGYFEFNFSPSGEWAAFSFDAYRTGMRPFDIAAPSVGAAVGPDAIQLLLSVPLPPSAWEVGLAAVIEDVGGNLSYWALAHPSDKPDFHHPDSFALQFPGPAT